MFKDNKKKRYLVSFVGVFTSEQFQTPIIKEYLDIVEATGKKKAEKIARKRPAEYERWSEGDNRLKRLLNLEHDETIMSKVIKELKPGESLEDYEGKNFVNQILGGM